MSPPEVLRHRGHNLVGPRRVRGAPDGDLLNVLRRALDLARALSAARWGTHKRGTLAPVFGRLSPQYADVG